MITAQRLAAAASPALAAAAGVLVLRGHTAAALVSAASATVLVLVLVAGRSACRTTQVDLAGSSEEDYSSAYFAAGWRDRMGAVVAAVGDPHPPQNLSRAFHRDHWASGVAPGDWLDDFHVKVIRSLVT